MRRAATETNVTLSAEEFADVLGRGTGRFLWLCTVGAAVGVILGLAAAMALNALHGREPGQLGWLDLAFIGGGAYLGYFAGKRMWFLRCPQCKRLGRQERVIVRVGERDQKGTSKQLLLRCPRCQALSGRATAGSLGRRRRR